MDLFTSSGISAWQQRLNSSKQFAEAARAWRGRLLLIETVDGGESRAAWVVVDEGRCTEARPSTPGDDERADFILAADDATWTDLVAARLTPTMAAIRGKLHLHKGDVMALLPHAKAAAELLAAAAD